MVQRQHGRILSASSQFMVGLRSSRHESWHDRLPAGENNGILECAAVGDKALLRSNLSTAAVQWHGDAAEVGRRPLLPAMLLAPSEKSQGFGDRVPNSAGSVQEPDEPPRRQDSDALTLGGLGVLARDIILLIPTTSVACFRRSLPENKISAGSSTDTSSVAAKVLCARFPFLPAGSAAIPRARFLNWE